MDNNKKMIGLVLGGGAALGMAHVGVLKALEEYNIKPDLIVGTSIGAIAGALHCAGYNVKELEEIAMELRTHKLFDLNLKPTGLVKGSGVFKIVKKYINPEMEFNDLKTKFVCNAVNLNTGKEEVFSTGNVLQAVRASYSVPGVFAPATINDCKYVDGGLLNNVPSNIARNLGANIVIAVDVVNAYEPPKKISNVVDIIHYSLKVNLVNSVKVGCADITIKPNTAEHKMHVFKPTATKHLIEQGYNATIEAIDEIKKIIS